MPQTINVGARSIFVTLTAWAFILLGAFSSIVALLQNAALASLVPGLQVVGSAPSPLLHGLSGLLMAYLPWVLGASFVLSLATLASAIGLLVRLEWARKVFIALLALAIVFNLLGLWMQQEVMVSLVDSTLGQVKLPSQLLGVFGGFVTAARVMAVVVTLSGCALLGWIIRRLMSARVRQEFA